jgi:hypothetical protein
VPLPPSFSHGVRSPLVVHTPRPFHPALASSMPPSRPLALEAQVVGGRATPPICRRPAPIARRSRCRWRSARRCRVPAYCADRPRCDSSRDYRNACLSSRLLASGDGTRFSRTDARFQIPPRLARARGALLGFEFNVPCRSAIPIAVVIPSVVPAVMIVSAMVVAVPPATGLSLV